MADRRLIERRAQTVEASKVRPAERRSACIALLEDAARRIDEVVPVREGVLDASGRRGSTARPSEDCGGTHGLR